VVTALKGVNTVGMGVIDAVGETVGVAVAVGVGGAGVGRSVSVGGMTVGVGTSVSTGGVGVAVAAGAFWQADKNAIRVITGTDNILLTIFSFDGYYGTISLPVAARVTRWQYTRFRMI
jgi:hypothetical protein